VLTIGESMARRLEHLTVTSTATLQRRGAFAERRYEDTTGALADLLGFDRYEARRRVIGAEPGGRSVAGSTTPPCSTPSPR
jgi:5-methylcytosine-specific restriction protein A